MSSATQKFVLLPTQAHTHTREITRRGLFVAL